MDSNSYSIFLTKLTEVIKTLLAVIVNDNDSKVKGNYKMTFQNLLSSGASKVENF